MNLPRRLSSPIATALLAAVAIALTGCSFDATTPPSGSGDIAGIIHGGPNPVVGATVTLYATGTTGYGSAATKLASTVSASDGSFSFNSFTYTCPGGSQAYVTSAGGNTGANTANANSLMMAAIGPCTGTGGLTRGTQVWIDELSTIASAYALGNFINITGTGAAAVVNVGAPANNNATTGSCTGAGTTLTCTAAGLTHAFLNAQNLVFASGTTAAPPTGQAYSTPASNPTTGATAAAFQNLVPQQLINTLGNILQACVNSSGASGTNACATLFTNTTPATAYTASPVIPTNTLQAMVNLAKFPFTGTTNLYNIAQTSGYYQPTLTAPPPDFSIGIVYRSYGSGVNQIGVPYFTTTDINDNVYATALTEASPINILGALPYIAHSLSSNGVGNWTTPATVLASSSTTYTCDSWAGTASSSGSCDAATDTAGHLWVNMGSTNFVGGGLWQLSQSSGAVTQFTTANGGTTFYPEALAVDANNDLFYSTANTTGTANFWKMPSGATSTTVPSPLAPGGSNLIAGHTSGSIVLDTAGNIFAPEDSGSNVGFTYAQNTGTLSAEALGTAANNTNALTTSSATPLSVDNWPTGGMVDGSGNYWFTGQSQVVKIAGPAAAQSVSTGASSGYTDYTVGNSATTLRVSSMDGAGNIFVPDNNTSGTKNPQASSPAATAPALLIYYPGTAGSVSIQGCNLAGATGNAACITGNATAPNSGLFYQAVNAAIDSTGSLWVSSEGNSAVIQILGLAAPTWPQASYLHPGKLPQ